MRPLIINLILLFFVCHADGQSNSPSAFGPVYLNHIYYFRPDSLTELEMTTGRVESKGAILLEGDKSTLRIKAGDSIRFTIKMGMSMMDPSMMIKLYKFDSKKGERESIMSQGGSSSRGKTTNSNEINFNIQKSDKDNFTITSASRLAPGEYGFMNMMMVKMEGARSMTYTIFAFGID
jgi:hypothetical protein